MAIELYFSDHFGVSPDVIKEYGAFDVSVVSDLPLFIDPFLLFNSNDPTYRALHDEIIRYLLFLRDRAAEQNLDPKLIDAWYRFMEVKQTWLGFTQFSKRVPASGRISRWLCTERSATFSTISAARPLPAEST